MKKLLILTAASVSGAVVFGLTWSTLRLDNEIKWVHTNKPFVCSQLLAKDAVLHGYQKTTLDHTYKEGASNAIQQAFLGTVMTTLAVERQTVNNMQVHYGCAVPIFKSNVE